MFYQCFPVCSIFQCLPVIFSVFQCFPGFTVLFNAFWCLSVLSINYQCFPVFSFYFIIFLIFSGFQCFFQCFTCFPFLSRVLHYLSFYFLIFKNVGQESLEGLIFFALSICISILQQLENYVITKNSPHMVGPPSHVKSLVHPLT